MKYKTDIKFFLRKQIYIDLIFIHVDRFFHEYTREFKIATSVLKSGVTKFNLNIHNIKWLDGRIATKKGLLDFIKSIAPEYLITITTKLPLSQKKLLTIKKTNQLLQRVNRVKFGRNYYKQDNNHLDGLAAFENKNGKTHNHYHLLVMNNVSNDTRELQETFHDACRKKIKLNGQQVFVQEGIDVQQIYDVEGIGDYIIKEFNDISDFHLFNARGIQERDYRNIT